MIWTFIWEYEKSVIQVSHCIALPDNTIFSDFYSDRVLVSDKKIWIYSYFVILDTKINNPSLKNIDW